MSIFQQIGKDVTGSNNITQAMTDAGLDWNVSKRQIFVQGNADMCTTNKWYANTRDDNDQILGIVGPDYQVIQNSELAYMAERVCGGNVKVETCGLLHGGERVWIQLASNPFDVGPNKDEVQPKFLLTNGHTGMHPLAALPTTTRVICENTLNMALNVGRKTNMMITLKHTGGINARIESLITAIEDFKFRTNDFQIKANFIAGKSVTTEFVQKFWTQVYVDMFGNIHNEPTTEEHKEDNEQAKSVMIKWANTFDLEQKVSGANLWTAMNAVTYWLDHDQLYRGKNKAENRFVDVLFGQRAKEKVNIMEYALSVA
jgi:phage/plasmid-like protein (TIGR03299 family)